jgi:hypothetical protein
MKILPIILMLIFQVGLVNGFAPSGVSIIQVVGDFEPGQQDEFLTELETTFGIIYGADYYPMTYSSNQDMTITLVRQYFQDVLAYVCQKGKENPSILQTAGDMKVLCPKYCTSDALLKDLPALSEFFTFNDESKMISIVVNISGNIQTVLDENGQKLTLSGFALFLKKRIKRAYLLGMSGGLYGFGWGCYA